MLIALINSILSELSVKINCEPHQKLAGVYIYTKNFQDISSATLDGFLPVPALPAHSNSHSLAWLGACVCVCVCACVGAFEKECLWVCNCMRVVE